jgi:putative spermidine/putrescine transport system substrate-binding protein
MRHTGKIPSRRAVLGAGLAAPLFFSRSAKADPKRLVIYNFDGELGKFYTENWFRPFEQANDVKIAEITMVGSAPPLDKLTAQINAGRPEADVVPLQPPQLVLAARNTLLLKLDKGALPEAENFHPAYMTDYGPKLGLWSYGLAYNTQKIKTPPTSWRDMWDPRFKGMVGLNDALFEQALQMVNIAFGRKAGQVDEETVKHLSALRPNLVSLWTTGAQAEQLFRSGEIAISPLWNGRVFHLYDQGVPLDFVVPSEGFFTRWNAYTVPRNAQNPEAATKFINFVMNEKRQSALADQLFYGSANRKVVYNSDKTKYRVIVATPENLAKVVPEDFEAIVDNMAEWSRLWTRWKAS